MNPFVLLGNGPSLADVEFGMLDGCDTLGLNAAYREYARRDWWPTYYGCFDPIMTISHQDAFAALIAENPRIERFFFLRNVTAEIK